MAEDKLQIKSILLSAVRSGVLKQGVMSNKESFWYFNKTEVKKDGK